MELAKTLEDVNTDWLTDILYREKVLRRGRVVSFSVRNGVAFNSRTAHLELTFDSGATGPERVFFKSARNADGGETAFYSLIKRQQNQPCYTARCLDVAFDPRRGISHLLLEDFSGSHVSPICVDAHRKLRAVPRPHHLRQIIDTVAEFHAAHWGKRWIGKDAFANPDWTNSAKCWRNRQQTRLEYFAAFLARDGKGYEGYTGQFTREIRTLHVNAMVKWPLLWESYIKRRFARRTNLTLIQGDCYFSQFLVPRPGRSGRAILIDYGCVGTFVPAWDLMYMFTTFWTRRQRLHRNCEVAMLRRYHRRLQSSGIDTYSWNDLIEDYRFSIYANLFHSAWDAHQTDMGYWWPKMQCSVAAFQDWKCIELAR
jgi:hypothetical protein